MSRRMLKRWGDYHEDRKVILEFFAWCNEHDYEIVTVVRLDELLNAYHRIDQVQLERERRALHKALQRKEARR